MKGKIKLMMMMMMMMTTSVLTTDMQFNLLNAELNPICHMLALLGAHHILHVRRLRVSSILEVFIC